MSVEASSFGFDTETSILIDALMATQEMRAVAQRVTGGLFRIMESSVKVGLLKLTEAFIWCWNWVKTNAMNHPWRFCFSLFVILCLIAASHYIGFIDVFASIDFVKETFKSICLSLWEGGVEAVNEKGIEVVKRTIEGL
eukprot:GFUD01129697.1.p1 GENE.GFUD01129697.1~~GFUD01129697.1.p1  ORF type:complete len:158 (-),score=25.77 GFUD01129697.1:100-516(-)